LKKGRLTKTGGGRGEPGRNAPDRCRRKGEVRKGKKKESILEPTSQIRGRNLEGMKELR